MAKSKDVIGLGDDIVEPVIIEETAEPESDVSVINEKIAKYKNLNDVLTAQGYVVLFNDTFDIATVSNDEKTFQINLDRPEEELLQAL